LRGADAATRVERIFQADEALKDRLAAARRGAAVAFERRSAV
jgi:hypothetical protein